jgi:hypothetical protein
MKFIEYLNARDSNLAESIRRTGIAHWAYPDAYIRSQYPANYFMPTAADALFKMGKKVDDSKVDHGQFKYTHHERMA